MPLSEEEIENQLCAECAMEMQNRKFGTMGPEGSETWNFQTDGSFLVVDEDGTTHGYTYPYCICHELEDTVCPCCLNDSYADPNPCLKSTGRFRKSLQVLCKGKNLDGFKTDPKKVEKET